MTCLKDKQEKERYLGLGNMEIKNALSKLRLPSFKLAIVTAIWFQKKRKTNMQILWFKWNCRLDSLSSSMPKL